jgi:uncharacterized protein YcbX
MESAVTVQISALQVYPVKSCAGITLTEATLTARGLENDRRWMVVDASGEFLSQRSHPRLALVKTRIHFGDLTLTAPGMLRLDLPVEVVEDDDSVRRQVRVWDDAVDAVDEGDLAASWFSRFLNTSCRLVKLHPDAIRRIEGAWAERWASAQPGQAVPEAPLSFADGYPLLVVNEASLEDLNRRLTERGHAPVAMNRFRPNLVLRGLPAWEEDHVRALVLPGGQRVALVKPCSRCSIPNVDPATGLMGSEPGTTLSGFRVIEPLGVCFGQNGLLLGEQAASLAVGDVLQLEHTF